MYSSWAIKQRTKILFSLSAIAFVVLAVYITVNMYIPPSCFDRKFNQDELGVDCGGTCSLMCASQIKPLNTVWTRAFQASPTFWSAFAYVENPNNTAMVDTARYRFTFYNRNNEVITEREGSMYITQAGQLPVFEGRIELGGQVPYRTEFTWIEPIIWHRLGATYDVVAEEQKISTDTAKPEITAMLVNKEAYPLVDIEVIALVFDSANNAIAVSKTYVDRLSPRGKSKIAFSWSSPFTARAERWQLIVRVPQQQD